MALRNKAANETVRADLRRCPRQLERIDDWIADGLLGGEQPNAADLQIGSTIRLLAGSATCALSIDGTRGRARALLPAAGRRSAAGALPSAWLAPTTSS